jgi:hypothetical protein
VPQADGLPYLRLITTGGAGSASGHGLPRPVPERGVSHQAAPLLVRGKGALEEPLGIVPVPRAQLGPAGDNRIERRRWGASVTRGIVPRRAARG